MWRVVTLAPVVLLAACQGPPTAVTPPPPPARPAADASAAPAVPSGLTPLPSSQQVVAAFPVGRRDPFASLAPSATAAQAGAGAKAAALKPPEFLNEFKVSGVIQGAGHAEAVVTYKTVSGSLRQGDLGGRTTDLLPSGWSVAAVDVQNGFLVLQNGGRKVKVDL
jgi:hypothetical protein